MPLITLTFAAPLNVSCQVGDTAYYVDTGADGGFTTNGSNNIVEIGQIRQINDPQSTTPDVLCLTSLSSTFDGENKFILFSKDNKANLSSILGYYAEVKLVNTSLDEAELFSVGVDMFESSK
jgi:hypothetical protein